MQFTPRRLLASVAIVTVGALAFSGCAATDSSNGDGGGDTLTLGMTADLTSGWDVVDQPSYQNWGIEAVYDTLVKCLPGGKLGPGAAESWEISDDRKSFTAKIREGMKFSDGSPVDAAAVEASFALGIETASDRYGGITFDSPDSQTITITWPDVQPLMEIRACQPFLASPDYLKSDNRDTAPVGSGPYTYDADASTTGSVYVLHKNDDYWDTDSYPYKNVELRVLADETASVNALKTGQIDGTVITAATYDEIDGAGLDIVSNPTGMLMVHLTDRLGEKIPALGDVRVRQALNMVLDKQAIVDSLFGGHAVPISQPFKEGTDAYIDDLKDPYPFDVDAAKALMAEAGYADGFTMTVPTLEGQPWVPIMPYLTQQFGELNITVEQDALSGPDAISTLLSGDYPVPVWTVGGLSSLEDITIHILQTGFWNVSHEPNATVDALWAKVVAGDAEQSIAAQQEINQYAIDQAWFVPIMSPDALYAYNGDDVTIDGITDPYGLHPRLIDFK